MTEPQLPQGVRYSVQGAFLLEVPGGDGDLRMGVCDYVVRDHGGRPSVMSAAEFERLYEEQRFTEQDKRFLAALDGPDLAPLTRAILESPAAQFPPLPVDPIAVAQTEPAPELPTEPAEEAKPSRPRTSKGKKP